MKLQLDFPIRPSFKKINLEDPVYFIGSCFSNEIGQKMSNSKFKVINNPFGTIFNPHSIFKILSGKIDHNDTVESDGVYYHWDAHGEVSALKMDELKTLTKRKTYESYEFVQKAKWLIITFGTAWVYRYRKSGEIVANCHKVPNNEFYKELLTIEEIADAFRSFKRDLTSTNPYINIVLTVSPVRHIKEGILENNRSKSRLIESVHDMVDRFENVAYFPAYEIMNDELRDYRWYNADLVHPSAQAINYIWEKFGESYFDDETRSYLSRWNAIQDSLNHRPFQPRTKSHQAFLKATLKNLESLNKKVDVNEEIKWVRSQLI
ncbi:MAG: GSCFA domain-containing protein [Bacteroidota bacterium]